MCAKDHHNRLPGSESDRGLHIPPSTLRVLVKNVTDRTSNPFGMRPPHDEYVAGYGDANAHFHVVGDHPGVHGGTETDIPFTDASGVERLIDVLEAVGLVERTDNPGYDPRNTFFSYLHMGVVDGAPADAEYDDMERFFDAELRAITAHVLVPVGERATRHVLANYTAIDPATFDLDENHATEVLGSGFLVYPVKDPTEWSDEDAEALEESLTELLTRDYRRETDLGRFIVGPEPYTVR